MACLPIHYREYWDRPRVFVVPFEGQWVLFDCPFNDALDEYPDYYTVGLMKPAPELLADGADWSKIWEKVVQPVGTVDVHRVEFQHCDNGYGIDSSVLSGLGAEGD